MSEDYPLIRTGGGAHDTTTYLTHQFYRWEERTRGYLLWDYPVSPEPPFIPFEGHFLPSQISVHDDTRKPTFLSSLADKIKSVFSPDVEKSVEVNFDTYNDPDESLADIYLPEGDICEFQISLPNDYASSKKRAEYFLSSQSYAHYPLSFEIIGTSTQVVVQLTSREKDASSLRNQLQAYVPEATITQAQNYLKSLWKQDEYSLVVDFGLANEGMFPLTSQNKFDVDPLIGIVGAISASQGDDVAIVQVLFCPVRNPWADSLVRSILDWDGTLFFSDAPELVAACKQKVSYPLYGALIRIGANSSRRDSAHNLVRSLGGAISQFNNPDPAQI